MPRTIRLALSLALTGLALGVAASSAQAADQPPTPRTTIMLGEVKLADGRAMVRVTCLGSDCQGSLRAKGLRTPVAYDLSIGQSRIMTLDLPGTPRRVTVRAADQSGVTDTATGRVRR